MEKQRSIKRELEEFKAYLSQKFRAVNTIKAYTADIKNLITHEAYENLLSQTDFPTEAEYYKGLADLVVTKGRKINPSLAVRTQHRKICTANMFLKFLAKTGKIEDYASLSYVELTGKRIETSKLSTITEDEFEKIIEAIPRKIKNKKYPCCYDRNRIMYPLMFHTGAKPSEIGKVKLSDFKRQDGKIVSVTLVNRHRRGREMPVNESLAKAIDDYITVYSKTTKESGKPYLSEESQVFEIPLRHMRRYFNGYAEKAELKGTNLSHLRNSFAKKLFEEEENDTVRAKRLGVSKQRIEAMRYAFS